MLFGPPDPDALGIALAARNAAAAGMAVWAETETGLFHHFDCDQPHPVQGRCDFRESPADAIKAGYRPCGECRPLARVATGSSATEQALAAVEADPGRVWRAQDLAELGLAPNEARKAFRRCLGIGFDEFVRYARQWRGSAVADRAPPPFAVGLALRLGIEPEAFTGAEPLKAVQLDTPLGPMIAVADDGALRLLEFMHRRRLSAELAALAAVAPIGPGDTPALARIATQLAAFFRGEAVGFDLPLDPVGGAFHQTVWTELLRIPHGQTCSYGDVAAAIGRPTATRAVARANGANPIAIVIPCHRVIGADGSLTGYGGGLWRKTWLIAHERRVAERVRTV